MSVRQLFLSLSKFHVFLVSFSLRSKRFCGFLEQRKIEERDFDNFAAQEMGTSEKMERGGRGKGMKETLASKGRYFAKRPQVVSVATCQLAALQ